MTREEWDACAEPHAMLEVGGGRASERKLRLFTCALVRRAPWGHASQAALGIAGRAEDWLDGLATRADALASAHRLAADVGPEGAGTAGSAASAASCCLGLDASMASMVGFIDLGHWLGPDRCAAILRCLFGNPCPPASVRKSRLASFLTGLLGALAGSPARPRRWYDPEPEPLVTVAPDPAWLTSTVVALARGIYEDRNLELMPILADALRDAGCNDEDVLSHCRGPSEHVKGCWCLDMVLGRS